MAGDLGAGPRVFVVRRGAPLPVPPPSRVVQAALLQPPAPAVHAAPLLAAPPAAPAQVAQAAAPPAAAQPVAQPMDILQEILRQQQVLRLQQQDALQNIPAAALGAPPPLPDGPPLNALQEWQMNWQQQQQQHLRQMQPFLAEPPAVAGRQGQVRPVALLPPPGAIRP